MDRISDSGSDGLGSNPDGSTKKEIKTDVFISFLHPASHLLRLLNEDSIASMLSATTCRQDRHRTQQEFYA